MQKTSSFSAVTTETIPFHAIIVAAGTGQRYGASIPKQYTSLHGKPVLQHTIDVFIKCEGLQKLVVVIHHGHEELFTRLIKPHEKIKISYGGSNRKESVYNGINAIPNSNKDDIVLIHDAARPAVTPELIQKVVAKAEAYGAACPAVAVKDTLKYQNGNYVNRAALMSIQTPQGFTFNLIKTAHEKAPKNIKYSDDTALAEAIGHSVHFIDGLAGNVKLTTPDDIKTLEQVMQTSKQTRIGTGFDVHAFDTNNSGPIRLCGIKVAHPHALIGHSDADVGLHALTDALFGAMADGDIGYHFPPTDPQWKSKDSTFFLEYAIQRLHNKDGIFINADITLICETPKLTPYRDKMRARIADICGADIDQIGLKATTTEQLGFTGRGEGIAAQASVLVEI